MFHFVATERRGVEAPDRQLLLQEVFTPADLLKQLNRPDSLAVFGSSVHSVTRRLHVTTVTT